MKDEALEMRLLENEGVIHGLLQAVTFLATLAKASPAFEAAAQRFVADAAVNNINAPLPDYLLEQSNAVLRQILLQGEQVAPGVERTAPGA